MIDAKKASVEKYQAPYSYDQLYELARPFFNEICLAFAGITIEDLEASTHGLVSKDGNRLGLLEYVALPEEERAMLEGNAVLRDMLRTYCAMLCVYIFAMSNQQIERLPFARFEDEEQRKKLFKEAITAGLRHKYVKLSEVFEKTKEKGYTDRVILYEQTLFERISIFVEILEAADQSNLEIRLKKTLLADEKYDGDKLFAPAEAKAVGEMFERARSAAGLNKVDASKASGFDRKNIRGLENGDHSPSVDTLHRYADGLGYKVRIELIPKDKS